MSIDRQQDEVVGSRPFDRFAKATPLWERLPGGRKTLDALIRKWRLSALGAATLVAVLSGDPVRRTQSTPRSVSARFPSEKTGRVVQCESRTVEFAFVHYCEYSPKVLLYADQPMEVEIRKGRSYVCDYLVVLEDGVCVYECKALEWLERQAKRRNPRYVYDEAEDRWRSPVAETAFAPYGFVHRVFHDGEVNTTWLNNVRFIRDFIGAPQPVGVEEALAEVQAARSVRYGDAIWLPGTTREAWLWLIASGQVVVDFENDRMDRPDFLEMIWIHDSRATLECHRLAAASLGDSAVARQISHDLVISLDPGAQVLLRDELHTVLSRDDDQVILRQGRMEDDAGAPVILAVEGAQALLKAGDLRAVASRPQDVVARCTQARLAACTDAERDRAMKRWRAIESYRATGKIPSGIRRRSLFRWLARARRATVAHGNEFLGVVYPRAPRPTPVVDSELALRREGRNRVPCRTVQTAGRGRRDPIPVAGAECIRRLRFAGGQAWDRAPQRAYLAPGDPVPLY